MEFSSIAARDLLSLLAGHYAISLDSEDQALTTLQGGQETTLVASQNLTQSGDLNLDIKTLQLSGELTVNHQTPPNQLTSTELFFDGRNAWTLSHGSQYTVTLLAGTYPIQVSSSDTALTTEQGGQTISVACP